MKHIWANPGRKWGGFRLAAYSLDVRVLGLPLTEKRVADGKVEEIPTTVGEIYKSLADRCVEVEEPSVETEITTDTEKLVVTGLSFNRKILEELLKLRNDGADPFSTQWFWYDHDWDKT